MDFSVSVEFGAKLDGLAGSLKQLISQVTQLVEKTGGVGSQTEAASKKAGAALTGQLARPAQVAAEALKALEQAEGQASRGAQDLKDKAGQAGKSLESLAGSTARASGTTHGLATDFALGTLAAHLLERGVELVAEGLSHFIGEGIKFNVTMESAKLGIGALIAAQTTLKDEFGRTLKGQEALNAGFGLAEGVMKQLRAGSFQTIATLEELTRAYQQGVGPMLAARVPLEETTKLTVKFAQAAGALGLDINTLGHELRATFNGEISPRVTKIAAALQISNADIQAWKDAGTLVQTLNEKLEFFGLAGERVEHSWRGAMSNLKHAMEAGSGEMLEPFQKRLQEAVVNSLSGAFDKNTAQFAKPLEGLIEMGRSTFEKLGELAGQGVAKVMGALEQLSAWYVRNRVEVQGFMAVMGNLAAFLGDTMKVAITTLCTVANALVTILGTFPVASTAVLSALGGLVVANMAASVSFSAVALNANLAAAAITEFFVAAGPIGWLLIGVGALGGALGALAKAVERDKQEQIAHAAALHKNNEEASIQIERLKTLDARMKEQGLTLAEKMAAEKESRDILIRLQTAGAAYLQGLDLQHESLKKLLEITEKGAKASKEKEAADKSATIAALANARASLLQAEAGMKAHGHTRESKQLGGLWTPQDVDDVNTLDAKISQLSKVVNAYGGEEQKVALTLAQQVALREKLLAEEKDLKALRDRLQDSPDSPGADAAFKKTVDRLKEIEKEKAAIRTSGLTVEPKPEKPVSNPDNKYAEEMIRLKAEELRYAERLTLEARKQAELGKVDLDLEAERTRTQKERAKGNLEDGERSAILAKAEEVARKAKANIEGKYADEERKWLEKHQLDLLQIQGRGLEAQILQRRHAALAAVEEMRKHGTSEADIQAYQLAVQAGIDRDLAKASEDLQEKLTASQGRGWERRKALIEKEYADLQEKMKSLNAALVQDGKLDKGSLGPQGLTSAQTAGLQAGKTQALKVGRADQVSEDLTRLKRELAELAQIKGRALSLDEEGEAMARFGKQSETAAEAVAKLRQELHRGESGSKGLQDALDGFVTKAKDAYQSWKGFGDSVLNGAESSLTSFYTSLTQKGQTAMEKLKGLWSSFGQAVVQALMKIGAQETILWAIQKGKLAWEAMRSAWSAGDTAKSVAEGTAKTTANTSTAASGFFASLAAMPFGTGYVIAAALVIAMLGVLKGITGRKVGGLVGQQGAELTMLGEEGLEVVAPEHDFKDWAKGFIQAGAMAANLQDNLGRREAGAQDYRQQAAAFALEAQRQGERNQAQGRPFSGSGGGDYQDFRGALFVTKDSREWAELVNQGKTTWEGMYS